MNLFKMHKHGKIFSTILQILINFQILQSSTTCLMRRPMHHAHQVCWHLPQKASPHSLQFVVTQCTVHLLAAQVHAAHPSVKLVQTLLVVMRAYRVKSVTLNTLVVGENHMMILPHISVVIMLRICW